MAAQDAVFLMGGTQIVVGLSQTVKVNGNTGPFQVAGTIKKLSGGTIALVSGSSAISSTGYVLGDTEQYNFDGPACFFLAAAGSTVTVGYIIKSSNGVTIPA